MTETTQTTQTNETSVLRDSERAALAEAASLVQGIGIDLLRCGVRSLPVAIRAACIAVGFGGSLYAGLHYWAVFGANEAAAIPALALSIAPLAYAMQARIRWGGVLAVGIASVALVSLLESLPMGGTELFTTLVLAVLVISNMAQRQTNTHEQSNLD